MGRCGGLCGFRLTGGLFGLHPLHILFLAFFHFSLHFLFLQFLILHLLAHHHLHIFRRAGREIQFVGGQGFVLVFVPAVEIIDLIPDEFFQTYFTVMICIERSKALA